MFSALLARFDTQDAGTPGVFVLSTGWTAQSLELPWRDNTTDFSCIPCGDYECRIVISPKWLGKGFHDGKVYEIRDVPGRTVVQLHPGNFAGDIRKGLKSNVEGCVLLGRKRGVTEGQMAVSESRVAFDEFYAQTNFEPFKLKIVSMCSEPFLIG